MIVSLQSHLQDPYLSVLQRENPDFDCRLDMTCMTCTLGATDTAWTSYLLLNNYIL